VSDITEPKLGTADQSGFAAGDIGPLGQPLFYFITTMTSDPYQPFDLDPFPKVTAAISIFT